MTYGEAHIAEQDSVMMIKGEFKKTLHVANIPKRMPRDKAVKYYNKKLFDYWLKHASNKKYSLTSNIKRLNYLMFRNTNIIKG